MKIKSTDDNLLAAAMCMSLLLAIILGVIFGWSFGAIK